MSYNIHHANPPEKPGLIDIDAIAQVIRREQPDLVGLQEVDVNTKRSGSINEAKLLAEKTGMFYHFFKSIDYDGGAYGNAILSKFPISNAGGMALPQVIKAEERALIWVNVTLPNQQKLLFSNTHLDAGKANENRIVQMKAIIEKLQGISDPVIIVGDLNSEPKQEPINLLDQYFVRSCITNCGFTIPQKNPKKTIDYIALKGAKWEVDSHRVILEPYASDHLPILTTYKIAP